MSVENEKRIAETAERYLAYIEKSYGISPKEGVLYLQQCLVADGYEIYAELLSQAVLVIPFLLEQLAASQRREKALQESILVMARSGDTCLVCKHFENCGDDYPCAICSTWCGGGKWEWRGPQEEEWNTNE